MDKNHIITINEVDVIGLGHGFKHDRVLDHPFFGTKVIEELKKDPGWSNGLITIMDYKPVFENEVQHGGLVAGFSIQ